MMTSDQDKQERSVARLGLVVLVLLGALGIFLLGINRSIISGYQNFTLAEAIEEVAPRDPLPFFQSILQPGIIEGRLLSLLLMALTLACLYRFLTDLLPSRQSVWVMLVGATISIPLATIGWTFYESWLSFIITASLLLLWKLTTARRISMLWQIVFVALPLGLLTWKLWWLLIAFYAVFAWIFSRRATWILRIYLLAAAGIGGMVWYTNTLAPDAIVTPTFWDNTYKELSPSWSALAVILWFLAAIGLLAWFADAPRRRYRPYFLLAACLLTPLISIAVSHDFYFILLPAFLAGVTICISMGIAALPSRTQVYSAAALTILFLLPHNLGTPNLNDARSTFTHYYVAGGPILVDYWKEYPSFAYAVDAISQLCPPTAQPIFYRINDTDYLMDAGQGHVQLITNLQLVNFPSQMPGVFSSLLVFTGNPQKDEDINKGLQLISSEAPSELKINYYHAPLTLILYRAGPLVVQKFDVLSPLTFDQQGVFSPGDDIMVGSWWSLEQSTDERYVVTAYLVNGKGDIVTSSDESIGQSNTDEWSAGTAHYDRLTLNIPAYLESGDYQVMLGVYSTVHSTDYQTFEQPDGTDMGKRILVKSISVVNTYPNPKK